MTSLKLPCSNEDAHLVVGGMNLVLTHLDKLFWPKEGIVKGNLLQYYANVAPYLLPHLKDRAMVMKRYPHGAAGESFFMKRAPEHRPEWVRTCSIEHDSGSVIDFAMVQDLKSLLWMINLGCIDLNPWYARCDDVNRPDYLHFDLDPTAGADFTMVRRAALLVHNALDELGLPNYAKTTGSTGMHIYIPIVRGPLQKQVWAYAKKQAFTLARQHPQVLTAEYRIAKRPAGRVLVDYNQNAWGRTLASLYSVRPQPGAPVSAPVTWQEVEGGVNLKDFTLFTMLDRLHAVGDLWKPLLAKRGRYQLEKVL